MLPPLVLTAEQAYRFALGQSIATSAEKDKVEVRVLDPKERLVGIGRINSDRSLVSPYKVFVDPATLVPENATIPT
jgi:hypothetical protein